MTRVLLIQAGPTPWDQEDRIVGAHSLPLTPEAEGSIRTIAAELTDQVTAVYRPPNNDACERAAAIIAARFNLRPRDASGLEAWHLGLWEGLTRQELKFRFPKVIDQWHEQPLAVIPPEGERLSEVIDRMRGSVDRILRRNRGGIIAVCVRPMTLQVLSGLLRRETPEAITAHLQDIAALATIDVE